jgi:hypothetical protein
MAAIAFPSTPSTDDIFTSGNRKWKWTGTRWAVQPVPIPLSRLSGEGAEVGDVVTWDGENYSPAPLTEGGSSSYLVQSAFAAPYNYIGRAPLGTATTSSGWDITRIEVASSGSTTVLNATGAWSNRASLSYT